MDSKYVPLIKTAALRSVKVTYYGGLIMRAAARRVVISLLLLATGMNGYAAPALAQSNGVGEDLTLDERFVRITELVPEFGGMYLDEDQRTLWVYVTERRPHIIAELRHAIQDVFPGEDLPATIRLKEGRFSFDQLKRWKDSATDNLAIPGVTMTDIDERANRLTIGVEPQGPRGLVEQELGVRGIPPEGWQIEEVRPAEPQTSLQDKHRPVVGGLQITNNLSTGACTYGFTATRNGVLGFVTNSHCTITQGGVEGSIFVQPTTTDLSGGISQFIGTETVDLAYHFVSTCPRGFFCRYSDSAFVAFSAGVGAEIKIAKPVLGTVTWDGVSKFNVHSEGVALVGTLVNKVGRTSGITSGVVSQTCADFGFSGTKLAHLCQTKATYASDGGDSGSPVFQSTGGCGIGVPCVRLVGIHWGSGGVFSPISNIQRSDELGPLVNCLGGAC
jgi:hypothetical protein